MHTIALTQLIAHPGNSNRMTDALFRKLVAHIAESGDYPPIIVRQLADSEQYQILDGHHRVKALAELGRTSAKCDIWQADDARATLLLLTLNRLQGSDDPLKRAALLAELAHSNEDLKSLEARLPEDRATLTKLLALREPAPPIAAAPALASMPHAITFFLTSPQRDKLLASLREVCTDRSAALVSLLNLDGAHA